MRHEIEDGMGFAGIVPTAAERRADAAEQTARRRIRELETALRHYVHCRHACPECNCTKEAKAALLYDHAE